MLALRSFPGWDPAPHDLLADDGRKPDAADWLSLQHAACELGFSVATVRRMIRNGRLRHRVVPRRGGFSYLVYLPNSRHACAFREPDPDAPPRLRLVDAPVGVTGAGSAAEARSRDDEIRALQSQIQHLSEALARSLRVKQRSLPPGIGDPGQNTTDPYGRYRWLTRKHRWWPF